MLEKKKNDGAHGGRKQILQEISAINVRLGVARKKYYSEETDISEYRAYKAECEAEITKLEAKLIDSTGSNQGIENLLTATLNNLERLDFLLKKYDTEAKRMLVNTLFKDKIHYDRRGYRTDRLNDVVEWIYLKNRELYQKKRAGK